MHDDVLEEAAKIVYDSWKEFPGWLPWEPNGNSLKQDEARGVAARILRIRDHYANAPKVSEQSKRSPFTIGDAPIRYFISPPNTEDVCVNCGHTLVWHNNGACPSSTILCSADGQIYVHQNKINTEV